MQVTDNDTTLPASESKALYAIHAELCKALANEHRQAILHALGEDEKSVGELAATLGISIHNASQHLAVLKGRGLVASRKSGQTVYYRVTNQKFIRACNLIREALIEQHLAAGESLQAGGRAEAVPESDPEGDG